jgi:putative sporulation protein YyaC
MGTLEHPVHAGNLEDTLRKIQYGIPNNYIIAIDSCLGACSESHYL